MRTEIRIADLRFSAQEAAAFLEQTMALRDLTPDEIAVLESKTEGWITGLQLAALSMQGQEDRASFLEALTGTDRYILDYIMDEVIPIQIARSVLLLIATIPVFAAWERTRRALYLRVGLGLWVLIGLMWTLMSFWMEPGMRIVHTLEVFADAMLYAGVLVALFPASGLREQTV